ncbi:NHLP bacteriocin system secretion protein [Paenibacillus sp. HJGM_3]|uniref:NHLP bacteriocin system secretion protein n=1 Tax=Paenibacillus sp. HJGM_3 TaxID=3379816 RepID=UPI00385CEEE1
MTEPLFRKASMEKLQSPDQLDRLLTVTSPRAWIALGGIAVLFLTLLIWSFTGTLPSSVNGNGILLGAGGIQQVLSEQSGQITDISVEPGDRVRKGQIVLRLAKPQTLADIRAVEDQLLKSASESEKSALQARLASLRIELETSSQIKSAYDGNVVEVKVKRGDFIQQASPLLTIEKTGNEVNQLQAVLYVPPQLGDTIHEGMEVKLHPSSVIKEQFGYLLGTVTAVDEYPSTLKSVADTVGNEELANLLAGSQAPIKVTVSLIPDAGTPSGYRWTTSVGPPLTLSSGMLSDGIVTLDRTHPIAKLFPLFK